MTEGMIYGALFVAAWTAVVLLHAAWMAGAVEWIRDYLFLRRIRRVGKRATRAFNDLAAAADELSPATVHFAAAWREGEPAESEAT